MASEAGAQNGSPQRKRGAPDAADGPGSGPLRCFQLLNSIAATLKAPCVATQAARLRPQARRLWHAPSSCASSADAPAVWAR